MKFKSSVYTQVSGSIGGLTYAHNAGGMYVRGRGLPTNPNSASQQAVRNALNELSTAWGGELTQTQRDDWATYASNVPVTDALGDPLTLTGQQMYIRCNAPRLRGGLARVDDGPTTMSMATLNAVSVTGSNGSNTFEVAFDDTQSWVDDDDAGLIIQGSRQMSPAINYFKGPFRLGDTVLGDSVTPPTSAASFASPFGDTLAIGNKIVIRATLSLADGRLSPVQMVSGEVEI